MGPPAIDPVGPSLLVSWADAGIASKLASASAAKRRDMIKLVKIEKCCKPHSRMRRVKTGQWTASYRSGWRHLANQWVAIGRCCGHQEDSAPAAGKVRRAPAQAAEETEQPAGPLVSGTSDRAARRRCWRRVR